MNPFKFKHLPRGNLFWETRANLAKEPTANPGNSRGTRGTYTFYRELTENSETPYILRELFGNQGNTYIFQGTLREPEESRDPRSDYI